MAAVMGWSALMSCKLESAISAHLIGQIDYLLQNMQGIGVRSCIICKKMAARLR
jgi:hypothetical protein